MFCTAVSIFLITCLYIYGRNQCTIACYTSMCDTKQQILTANLKWFCQAACKDMTMHFEHVGLTHKSIWGSELQLKHLKWRFAINQCKSFEYTILSSNTALVKTKWLCWQWRSMYLKTMLPSRKSQLKHKGTKKN